MNRRPLECHSSALPTELWPQAKPHQRQARRGQVRGIRTSGAPASTASIFPGCSSAARISSARSCAATVSAPRWGSTKASSTSPAAGPTPSCRPASASRRAGPAPTRTSEFRLAARLRSRRRLRWGARTGGRRAVRINRGSLARLGRRDLERRMARRNGGRARRRRPGLRVVGADRLVRLLHRQSLGIPFGGRPADSRARSPGRAARRCRDRRPDRGCAGRSDPDPGIRPARAAAPRSECSAGDRFVGRIARPWLRLEAAQLSLLCRIERSTGADEGGSRRRVIDPAAYEKGGPEAAFSIPRP